MTLAKNLGCEKPVDLSGVYLSLNQGVTCIRDVYGADAKKSLIVRAVDCRARLGSLAKPLELSEISLKVPSNSLGAFYEAGNICAAFLLGGSVAGSR